MAGLALGVATVAGSFVIAGDAQLPFRFASALVVGPQALDPAFPLPVALLLGLAIHFSLAALLGMLFVGLLAVLYQLSARWWLVLVYGALFGVTVWEINFLAVVPAFFPFLVDRLDLATQFWNGIVCYTFVFGPVLGAYVVIVRPGVIGDWRAVGAPAGVFNVPTEHD